MDQRCWDLAKHYIDDHSSSNSELDKARTTELGQEIQNVIDEYIESLDENDRRI